MSANTFAKFVPSPIWYATAGCQRSYAFWMLFSPPFSLWFSASLCWAGCFNFKCYKKRSNLRFMIKYWKALQTSVDNTFNRFDVLFACFTTSEQIVHFEVPTTSVDLVKKCHTALLRHFPASKFPDEEAFASRSLLAKIAFQMWIAFGIDLVVYNNYTYSMY